MIAGSGQNVGKTTFVCRILQNEKDKNPVAVKITPHFHKITAGLIEIDKGENWNLFEETDKTSNKDSSLYLQNGAIRSYLILANDSGLKEAFFALRKFLTQSNPVIIESAALVHIIQPGLFVMVLPENKPAKKYINSVLKKADLVILSDGITFNPSPLKITFKNSWYVE